MLQKHAVFYKKPGLRPSNIKNSLLSGYIVALKVSEKFLNLTNYITAKS